MNPVIRDEAGGEGGNVQSKRLIQQRVGGSGLP